MNSDDGDEMKGDSEPIVGTPEWYKKKGIVVGRPGETVPLSKEKLAEYDEMIRENAREQNKRYNEMTNVDAVSDLAGLREVMTKYVLGMYEYEARSVRLYELNKRFGMKCIRLGSTTKEQMNMICETDGNISGRAYRGFYVYYDYMAHIKRIQKIPLMKDKDQCTEEMLNRSNVCLLK